MDEPRNNSERHAARRGPALSVVAPCYNEEEGLGEFIRRTTAACAACVGADYELILVNDGSRDGTWDLIQAAQKAHPQIVGIDLFRNHGHQLAVTAGLAYAGGDRVLLIDADLQDPPELLAEMMARMDEGYDVVYGQRRMRAGESRFKLATAALFYRTLGRLSEVDIPVDTGDFRLMTRRIVLMLNEMPERHRFVRGMVAWIGGRQSALLYDRDARFAGETKYPLRKMIRFAADGLTSFSVAPLRFATLMAMFAGFMALVFAGAAVYSFLAEKTVSGWTSLAVVVSIFSSAQLFAIGIIGEYLARTFVQVKGRPMFMVRQVLGSDGPR